eukprot:CAMPEP_0206583574 /NCGR_PEP_ID=MMETSP0325_2-20121206/35186_1 /ASSEMBLY_ACC=CAM_ASM_000347 /TAXON_ID=2866 /ORGANISM="Crypthecodinium cohnii, Strain Seligo" /LENGTH=148 /DNA_ID=CAMNT_0054090523 /DNA_START=56 /DNA_END=499 /DNA_ORIENTATION=+
MAPGLKAALEPLATSFWGGGSGVELREYYAAACPHCQDLDGPWKDAASQYGGPVKFKQIECADNNWRPVAANREVCSGIEAYPTIKLFKDGKEVMDYDGDRSAEALMSFAKEHENVATQSMHPLAALCAPTTAPEAKTDGPVQRRGHK